LREGKEARPDPSFTLEMLHLRAKLQNDEYRKEELRKEVASLTYLQYQARLDIEDC
jgi:hypothetical protein